MRIVAYSYLAALHCPCCTRHALEALAEVKRLNPGAALHDEYGLPDDMIDREGNPVRPVFSTDEVLQGAVCDDCSRPFD